MFNYCDTAGAKTLVDATQGQMPAASDVRSGVSYASGALTGSCAVPAAGSTALGVPVDNTTGTAVLTPAAVWSYASRTTTGGTVDTLTNAPASVTPNDIWAYNSRTLTSASGPSAVEIRAEMDSNSTKLANLDASVSSRLAGSAYTAPTTPPTAADIAAAVEGSLLNDADGQAVLNAIVGAIGNTNLSEVSLVAAVRADLERAGGKLDNIPTTAAPSASAVASATRTELSTELSRIDQAISSRLASASYVAPTTPPTVVEIRQEIDANSTKLDASVSTRLASTAATDLAAVKAKTDALNTERLANVPTVNILGTLLAQANS